MQVVVANEFTYLALHFILTIASRITAKGKGAMPRESGT